MSAAAAIQLTRLQFGWSPTQPLLDIPEFAIERGERVFLRGPSGSGKSTLLALIGGVLQPTSGSLRVLGTALEQLSQGDRDAFRADHMGFIFQLFNLVPYLSVLDNVMLAARFSRRRAAAAGDVRSAAAKLLRALQLDEPALLQRPVTQLSIGQQQRVAAARALLGKPELLIADEPTSSLDHDARAAFLDLLIRECADAGTTLLFVSHDPTLSSLFDRSISLAELNRAHLATAATAA